MGHELEPPAAEFATDDPRRTGGLLSGRPSAGCSWCRCGRSAGGAMAGH